MKSFINIGLLSLPLALGLRIPSSPDEPMRGRSYVTALLVEENGRAHLECWKLEDSQSSKITHSDGSESVVRSTRLGDDTVASVLQFDAHSQVYPVNGEDDEMNAKAWRMPATMVNVKEGFLHMFGFNENGQKDRLGDLQAMIFGPQNGDDWLFFYDKTPTGRNSPRSSLRIEAPSNTGAELIILEHSTVPKYRKVADTRCNYNGFDTIKGQQRNRDSDSAHGSLELNLQIQEV